MNSPNRIDHYVKSGRVESRGAPITLRSPLRIGFISPTATLTPESVSGMPFRMRALLAERLGHASTLLPASIPSPIEHALRMARTRAFPIWRAARAPIRRFVSGVALGVSDSIPGYTFRTTLANAARASDSIQKELGGRQFDVLFGCCISSALSRLHTAIPIVYFSDTTAKILTSSYPQAMRRCRGYKAACDELERLALSKCAAAVFATEEALRSAIDDYGLDPSHGHIVPMGANVFPDAGAIISPEPPRDRRLRLCIVASDPVRKRLDLAIRATELLAQRGWRAELIHVGPPTRRSERSSVVVATGRLRLGDPADRRRHQEILATSHLMLLPSRGEVFGIAPCEAAHFGRPSIVSAAGGLPSVVQHNRTGLVMPMDAKAGDYADAIDTLMRDEPRYLAMCHAALARARGLLCWERWADSIAQIIRGVVLPKTTAHPLFEDDTLPARVLPPVRIVRPVSHAPASLL